jgi:hypothetical protein
MLGWYSTARSDTAQLAPAKGQQSCLCYVGVGWCGLVGSGQSILPRSCQGLKKHTEPAGAMTPSQKMAALLFGSCTADWVCILVRACMCQECAAASLLCAACSWCQEPVFTSWVYEWATRLVVFARQLLLTYVPYPM